MFFGGEARQRVKDVGIVRGAFLDGPVLHGRRDGVGDVRVELFPSSIVRFKDL